jgi:hypothetical protein
MDATLPCIDLCIESGQDFCFVWCGVSLLLASVLSVSTKGYRLYATSTTGSAKACRLHAVSAKACRLQQAVLALSVSTTGYRLPVARSLCAICLSFPELVPNRGRLGYLLLRLGFPESGVGKWRRKVAFCLHKTIVKVIENWAAPH